MDDTPANVEEALTLASDAVLQRLWRVGVESGDAGEVDFEELKIEARKAFAAR